MISHKGFVWFAILLLLASGFSFASTTSSASLQVSSYSITPQTVYPGSRGYIQLTLSNTGTDTATGISVQYTDSFTYKTVTTYSTDLAQGGTSQVTIPFSIPTQLDSGLLLYRIEVFYNPSPSSGDSKATTASVPITISQHEILEVDTLSSSKGTISPGEKLTVVLNLRNTGGTVNNLMVLSPQNSSFSLDGSSRKSIGSLPAGSNQTIFIDLISSSLTQVGQYTIPLTFTYQDALQSTVTQTIYVGPVSVLESSTQFQIDVIPLTSTEIGSQAKFRLSVRNSGTLPTSALVSIGSTSVFTPLGTGRVYFDSIQPGTTATEDIDIGISASSSSGFYSLPLNVTLGTGKTISQALGIVVEATPEIRISGELSTSTSASEIVIQISNTGNTPIRSVYAIVEAGGAKTEKFIGTMSIDDYSTVSLSTSFGTGNTTGSFPSASGGMSRQWDSNASQPQQFNRTQQAQSVKVTVTFKDEQNQPHTVTQVVSINSAGSGLSSLISRTTRSNGVLFGFDAIQLAVIAIVIAAVAYYFYKKRQTKKLVEE